NWEAGECRPFHEFAMLEATLGDGLNVFPRAHGPWQLLFNRVPDVVAQTFKRLGRHLDLEILAPLSDLLEHAIFFRSIWQRHDRPLQDSAEIPKRYGTPERCVVVGLQGLSDVRSNLLVHIAHYSVSLVRRGLEIDHRGEIAVSPHTT